MVDLNNQKVFKISDKVNSSQELHLEFEVKNIYLTSKTPRIVTTCQGDLFVNVRNPNGFQDIWQHSNAEGKNATTIGRTLWIDPDIFQNSGTEIHFTVIISTENASNVGFEAEIGLVNNYLTNDIPSTSSVSPTTPFVWRYDSLESQENETVIVMVNSTEVQLCAIISVQPLHLSLARDIKSPRGGRWQTMLGHAVIDVKLEGNLKDGFFVIARTLRNDRPCLRPGYFSSGVRSRIKNIEVKVEKNKYQDQITLGIILVIFMYVVSCGMGLAMALCFAIPLEGKFVTSFKRAAHRTSKKIRRNKDRKAEFDESDEVDAVRQEQPESLEVAIKVEETECSLNSGPDSIEQDQVDGLAVSKMVTAVDEIDSFIQDVMLSDVKKVARRVITTCSSPSKSQSPLNQKSHAVCRKEVIEIMFREQRKSVMEHTKERRKQQNLTLCDLAVTLDKDLYPNTEKLKSSLYLWILGLVSIFYTLPVGQLLYGHQRSIIHDGNLDLCYFNFLCKVSFMGIEDFGHFFSNISYLISGIFFIIMTR